MERLCQLYPPDHDCYLYQAGVAPGSEPLIQKTTIQGLAQSAPPMMATVYIPPARAPVADPVRVDRIPAIAGPAEPAGMTTRCV